VYLNDGRFKGAKWSNKKTAPNAKAIAATDANRAYECALINMYIDLVGEYEHLNLFEFTLPWNSFE